MASPKTLRQIIQAQLWIEYENLYSFYIIAFIIGILCCLNGVNVPDLILFVGVCICGFGVCWGRHKSRAVYTASMMVLFVIGGIFIAEIRLLNVKAPVLSKPLSVELRGVVEETTPLPDKQTLILSDVRFLNEPNVMSPEKVKLTYYQSEPRFHVGETIKAHVFLRPPLSAVYPGAYDEAKRLFFHKIGAVGSIQTPDEITLVSSDSNGYRVKLEMIRTAIQTRLRDILPDELARFAIPLVIGEQGVVSDRLYGLFQSAGITHILSVSGFHLSLLAAFVFFLIRGLISLIPALVERVSAKKIAAVVSLLFSVGYVFLSGMQIPAIRSVIMLSVVLIALLFDRNALSVRSLTVAAFLILIFRPEMILNIGFQLSFMAVLILVTLYQPLSRFLFPQKPIHPFTRLVKFLAGFLLVDLLMTIATTPLVIYHFNRYALYSAVGNMLTGTILSFWVMPLLMFATVLMPMGWEVPFLKAVEPGLQYVISVCEHIERWPGALTVFPSYSMTALLIILFGVICLCLMKTKLRFVGIIISFVGIVAAFYSPRPDLLVGDKGLSVAYRDKAGKLQFLIKGKSDYVSNTWLLHNGEELFPVNPEFKKLPETFRIRDYTVAFSSDACPKADICFLPERKTDFPNAYPLYKYQTRAVYFKPSGIKVWESGADVFH